MAVGLITGLPNEDYESHEKAMDWISDKNNNVDRVTANALVISDPSRSYNPWQSDFQKKSKDYGYNWPTENIYDWRNSKGPVKSFEEAQVIQKQYQERMTQLHNENNKMIQPIVDMKSAYQQVSKSKVRMNQNMVSATSSARR